MAGFIIRQAILALADQTDRHAKDLEADTLVSMSEGACNNWMSMALRRISAQLRDIAEREPG